MKKEMADMLGIKGIQIKTFDLKHDEINIVNDFLMEYDGSIIDIQVAQMLYGVTRYVIVYKAKEED